MNNESVIKPDRSIRRAVYVLGATFIIAIGVLVVMNIIVSQRIRRIVEHGGVVRSWSSSMANDFTRVFGVKFHIWFEDTYVIRDNYDVFLGDLDRSEVSCGMGITFQDSPDEPEKSYFDPGDDGPLLAHTLRNVVRLSLAKTTLTDAGLEHLRDMDLLEGLDLASTHIQGSGLVHLKGLPLNSLSLDGTAIDDAGLEQLPELPLLRHLDLGDTRITGRGVSRLRIFQLKTLDLRGTHITDDAIHDLSDSPVESLNLYNTPISDAAIAYLEKMPHLRNVHLCGTRITTDAAKRSTSEAVRSWPVMREFLCRHPTPSP